MSDTQELTTKKRGRGRPRKAELSEHGKGSKNAVGRPKGDAAVINEYKQRMLASPKSRHVLEKIFDAALDDDHKHQASAWKLIADRIVPASYFEKDRFGGKAPSIDININIGDDAISGDSVGVSVSDDAVDAEFEHMEEPES